MNIEQLIKEKCPNGVEYKKIWDICILSQWCQVPVEEQYTEYEEWMVPFLRIIDFTQNTEPRYIKKVSEKYMKNEWDLIMIRYWAPWQVYFNKAGAIANNMFKMTFDNSLIVNKFAYYYLNMDEIQNKLLWAQWWALPSIKFEIVNKIEIPIPPIEIQNEIVNILDKFTELEAELEARKSQYEYYRDKLLTFGNSAERERDYRDWSGKN